MLILALLGLALLILGSGAFVLLSQKNTNITPNPQNTSTAHRATPAGTHNASTPAPGAGGLNRLNTPVQAGTDWIVTLTSASTTSASLIAPNTGHTYLELHLELKNTSQKTLTVISILEFTLHDSRGQRYNETATDTNLRRTPDGNLGAHQSLDAQLAYEVPTTQHAFILTFAYGLSANNNGSVSWQVEI